MANTYLSWTPSGAGSTTKWTTSFWVKRGTLGSAQELVANWSSGTDNTTVRFLSGDTLDIVDYQSSSVVMKRVTNRVFRDTSAWYHIVVNIDTDEATANDRTKLYINGVQETSFSTTTNYSLGQAHKWNTTYVHNVGQNGGGSGYFNGSISHLHMIDGTVYDATAFGEYDANGVWKIKTSPSVTYGTNGFFILKDGNSVTDQSGNSNNFTVGGGTLTNTEDSPSNVFATANPLDYSGIAPTLGNGNLSITSAELSDKPFRTTIAVSKGKWYMEYKCETSGSDNYNHFGLWSAENSLTSNYVGYQLYSWGIFTENGNKRNNQSYDSYGSAIVQNDIVMIALDKDNGKIWWGKNGTWFNSGNPASGTNEAFSNINTVVGSDGFVSFCFLPQQKFSLNFGNGYFGTTAVASAGTNASGNGIFEYDVPTGFTALSTKGLNL